AAAGRDPGGDGGVERRLRGAGALSAPPPEPRRMRVELDGAPGEPAWPAGIRDRSFRPGDAQTLHALLEHAYRHGGGRVDAFETWLPAMTGDHEFDADLWFLAEA